MVEDNVNHPKHYNAHPAGIECIDVVEHMSFNLGNAIKYLWRAGLKSNATTGEDLRKAVWYIRREIKRLGLEVEEGEESERRVEAEAEDRPAFGTTRSDRDSLARTSGLAAPPRHSKSRLARES